MYFFPNHFLLQLIRGVLMINKVDNAYFKEGEVQLMLPICDNCTFFGPKGIKFHSHYGKILINDYVQQPKRKLFPYHEIPTHKNDKGDFANQLFQLNQQYLAVYTIDGTHQFRMDTFFQDDQTIYVDSNVELKKSSPELKEISLEELKEKIRSVLFNNSFLYIIDDDGKLYEYSKNALEFELPLSGVTIIGDGSKLKAYNYEILVTREQISIKRQELKLKNKKQLDLENCTSIPEPIMHKR